MLPSRDNSPIPLYEKAKHHILARVKSGEWVDGTRLPSEQDFVRTLGVSRMTVHRALRELFDKGLVTRVPGVGTFVSTPQPRSPLIEIRDIAEDITARGHRHSARVVKLEAVMADPELAAVDSRPRALSRRPPLAVILLDYRIWRPVWESWIASHNDPKSWVARLASEGYALPRVRSPGRSALDVVDELRVECPYLEREDILQAWRASHG